MNSYKLCIKYQLKLMSKFEGSFHIKMKHHLSFLMNEGTRYRIYCMLEFVTGSLGSILYSLIGLDLNTAYSLNDTSNI